MKIIIQGSVVDTCNIQFIHEIIENGIGNIEFTIVFLNNSIFIVSIPRFEETSMNKLGKGEIFNDVLLRNIKRLENMRTDIINIWSDNQSTLPSFNTQNYL